MDGTGPSRGCGQALNFAGAMCHLVRAVGDRRGDVVADFLTSPGQVVDHVGDTDANVAIILRRSWGEPHGQARADERSREESQNKRIRSWTPCRFIHGVRLGSWKRGSAC